MMSKLLMDMEDDQDMKHDGDHTKKRKIRNVCVENSDDDSDKKGKKSCTSKTTTSKKLCAAEKFNDRQLLEVMKSESLPANKYGLHFLTYHGHIAQITELPCIEDYINEQDDKGCSPLNLACAQNYTAIAKYLINVGADVNCRDHNLSTPLHWAVYNNNIELVQHLIEKQAEIYVKDSNGILPIHLAALKGHIQIINFLKPPKNWIQITDNLGITPLHLASHCGHHDVIKALLDITTEIENDPSLITDLDVNTADNNDIRSLHLAAASNHIESVKLLVERGAGITLSDSYGSYPIHWAAVNGNVEMIKILNFVPTQSGLDCLDNVNCSPLFLASAYGHVEAIKFLLQNNYNLNLKSGQREIYLIFTNLEGLDDIIYKYYDELASLSTTLHWAAAFCSKNILEQLINDGAKIENNGIYYNTILHTAACFGNKDVVELLIDKGVELDREDNDDNTALHWSIAHGHIEIVQLLLDKGADKSMALCRAANFGNLNIVKLLIENNCDVNEYFLEYIEEDFFDYNSIERTPLFWASDGGHTEVIEYLLDNDIGIGSDDHVLHYCAFHNLIDRAKTLIEQGANVNDSDIEYERITLHWAVIGGNVDMTKYLLSVEGVKVNATDKRFKYPIDYAIIDNHYEIVKILIEHDVNIIEYALPNLKFSLRPAIEFGHTDIVDYLLEKGIDKKWFLNIFAEYGSTFNLKKYMEPEDVDIIDDMKRTPLFCAVRGKNTNNLKYLIDNGADMNYKDKINDTLLYLAVELNYLEGVQILIENGADVNHKDNINRCPLSVAIENNTLNCAKLLINSGADVTLIKQQGFKFIITAIQCTNLGMIKLLVNYNADIKAFDDKTGMNALHYATKIPGSDVKLQIFEYILSKNVDINMIDFNGYTPLQSLLKCFNYFLDEEKMLRFETRYDVDDDEIFWKEWHLEFDDEVSVKCVENERYHNKRILHLILDNGAEINRCRGMSLLSWAIHIKNYEFVKLFIIYGANIHLNYSELNVKKIEQDADIPIVKILLFAGLDFYTNKKYLIVDCDLHSEHASKIQSFIKYVESNPLNLKELCRISCLNTFGKNYVKYIKSQMLPNSVKQYLLFDQL